MEVVTYSVTVEYLPEDGVFYAEVPALPGCWSWGRTVEQAKAHVTEAIECYLEGRVALKEAVPREPSLARISVPLPAQA